MDQLVLAQNKRLANGTTPTCNLAAAMSPQKGARKCINRLKFHNFEHKDGTEALPKKSKSSLLLSSYLIHDGALTIIMRSQRST